MTEEKPMFNNRRQRSRGFTLIELMVAMFIGLLLLGGLIQIFLANRAAYRVMEGAGFMQENMRFAVDRIAQSMRLADHWGTLERSKIVGAGTGATLCTADWARNLTQGVWAVDGAATLPPALAGCTSITSANYQPGTDVIMVRYAGPDTIAPATTLAATQYYIRVATGRNTGFMYLGNAPNTQVVAEARQYLIMPFNAEMFWVRRCSDPGANGTCGDSDDGDTPIAVPTLMRSYIAGDGSWTSEAVAEGMEQLQIEYQVMNRQWMNATAAASFSAASGGSPWDYMTGARIAGVMRSSQRDPSFPADTRTFNLSGDTTAYTPPTAAQKFMRVAYEANVVIRNRVRPAPPI